MNATVVIPTYWAGDDTQANAPGTYDHSTSLNAANPELDRCLTSLEQVRDIPRIILLVVCPVSATADVSHRVHEIVNAHPTLKVTVVTNTQASRVADRVAQIAPKGSGEAPSATWVLPARRYWGTTRLCFWMTTRPSSMPTL